MLSAGLFAAGDGHHVMFVPECQVYYSSACMCQFWEFGGCHVYLNNRGIIRQYSRCANFVSVCRFAAGDGQHMYLNNRGIIHQYPRCANSMCVFAASDGQHMYLNNRDIIHQYHRCANST